MAGSGYTGWATINSFKVLPPQPMASVESSFTRTMNELSGIRVTCEAELVRADIRDFFSSPETGCMAMVMTGMVFSCREGPRRLAGQGRVMEPSDGAGLMQRAMEKIAAIKNIASYKKHSGPIDRFLGSLLNV
jgi:hypothetical protein